MFPSDSESNFFFCIGCQKSGTTLLARVLDQHPDIACIWESYSLWSHWCDNSIMNLKSDNWKKHGFSESDVKRWSQIWSEKQSLGLRILGHLGIQKDNTTALKFKITMTEALTDFAKRCEATIVGDKWPFYIDHLEILLKSFPNAKLIYNVRDPRGIWNSAQNFKERMRGDKILFEMLDKDKRVEPYVDKKNFITIRYEDLVLEPIKTCSKLYQFLGCDFSEDYLIYNPQTDHYPNRWGWVSEASEQFNPLHTTKWKEKMEPCEIKRVTELAASFIHKYGYEL